MNKREFKSKSDTNYVGKFFLTMGGDKKDELFFLVLK